jgi:iron complex outermembrane receptor protein
LEHNAYTGFEYEPSARLAWALSPRSTLWVSASRAIRQPSHQETSVNAELATYPLDADTIATLRLLGNPLLETETVLDYELGFRARLAKHASLDAATFLSSYGRLATLEPGVPVVIPEAAWVKVETPVVYRNMASALNYGGELSVNWNVSSTWRIVPAYSYLKVNIHPDPASQNLDRSSFTAVPRQVYQVRSIWNITRRLEFDPSFSWVAKLPPTDIPAYARLDARLARRFGESVEISLVGQNLLRPGTIEFSSGTRVMATLAERSIYGRITWAF